MLRTKNGYLWGFKIFNLFHCIGIFNTVGPAINKNLQRKNQKYKINSKYTPKRGKSQLET